MKTIREILFTAGGIRDIPMEADPTIEELKSALRWALVRVSVGSLQEIEEYYRYQKLSGTKHYFDATNARESNEPDICGKCGLDLRDDIHVRNTY